MDADARARDGGDSGEAPVDITAEEHPGHAPGLTFGLPPLGAPAPSAGTLARASAATATPTARAGRPRPPVPAWCTTWRCNRGGPSGGRHREPWSGRIDIAA